MNPMNPMSCMQSEGHTHYFIVSKYEEVKLTVQLKYITANLEGTERSLKKELR